MVKGHWCQEFGKESSLFNLLWDSRCASYHAPPTLSYLNASNSRIQEIPEEFANIPYQTMECVLSGLKPLTMVTSYFDLTIKKQ
jgi:hypothetical protein